MNTAVRAPATTRFNRVDGIFDAALDVPPGELTAFVERECSGDEALRAEEMELVRAYHEGDSFLEAPAARLAAPLREAAAAIGGAVPEHIGPFRVAREIGRGGMGRVFLGERIDGGFEQRVAIKLIQHGAPGVLRRFVEERRILALLEHPGIARLVDGGITDGGLPYFAMELVEGEPIDRYCEAHALTLDQRLELFVSVCDAVAYAHRHLVIHRDLKPSNILVSGSGNVKLLDFGIAKLLGTSQRREDATGTSFSAMTPEFAAPEQIRNAPISTATDVYSLGVLLHVLLTGERPYDIRGKSPAEIERIVCDDVPPRPSTRVGAELRRRLRGDLDQILMTAIAKEPERRYQSPTELAQDIQRFRSGRAIHARADSATYRLRKFIGRHKGGVALALLLVTALAAGAARERTLRNRAQQEARKAREVEQFLIGVFDVADPHSWTPATGENVSARELLERGARTIDSTLAGQPEVQAELRGVLGRVFNGLGLHDKAVPLLRASLAQRVTLHGQADTSVAESMDMVGVALTALNKYADAEPLLRGALAQRRRLLGNAHAATAQSVGHLATLLEARNEYDAAERLYREAIAIQTTVSGDSAVEVADALSNLGVLLYRKGVYAEAESLQRRALDVKLRRLGENHASTAATMQSLAQALQSRRNFVEAERYYRRSLDAKRRVLGDAHPSVTLSMNNLANLLTREMDRLDEGEALAREALALDRKLFGETHSYVAASLANLGAIRQRQGKLAEADSLLRQALAVNRAVFGERHGRVAYNLNALSLIRAAMGDHAQAIAMQRQSYELYRALLGDRHRSTITTLASVGFQLAEHGNPREAEQMSRKALGFIDSTKTELRLPLVTAELALGKALLAQRKPGDAIPVLARVSDHARDAFGKGNWRTGDALLTYGTALVAARRRKDAEPVLREAHAALASNPKANPRTLARAARAVATLPR